MFSRRKVPAYCAFVVLASFLTSLVTNRHIMRESRLAAKSQMQPEAASLQMPSRMLVVKTPEETKLRVEAAYGNLPLSFEPNRGQTDRRVKFISRAGNHTLWLTKDEAVLALRRPLRLSHNGHEGVAADTAGVKRNVDAAPAMLRMKFLGANPNAAVVGETKQPGTVNYFIGKPEQWRTKIPTYARVRYRNIYPGIDLVFYGNNRELEYDLVVAPGTDPEQIKLGISGAESLRIDGNGNLVLQTVAGDLIEQKPRIYQRRGRKIVPVVGEYLVTAENEVGFRLDAYDHRAAVVIDPVLRYSTFLGGSEFDAASAIAVDSQKSAVVVGRVCSSDFPITPGKTPPNPAHVMIANRLFLLLH